MIKKVFYLALILLLGVGIARPEPAAAAVARLSGLRLSVAEGGARAQLDLSRSTRAQYFTLGHPDRAVVDLDRTRSGPGLRLPRGRGLVSRIRIGRRPNGALRIVFVLRSAAAVRLAWRPTTRGRPRLLVEFSGTRTHVPAAAGAAAAVAASITPMPIDAEHAPRQTRRDIVIAVDPGHGGVDPGTIGHYGTEEKNVTLAIGRLLARRIDEQPGMRAVLTRDSDVFLPLRERIRIARRADADLFISIHADDVSDRHIRGASVYILSLHGASSEAARILAARENSADLKGGLQLDGKSRTLASVLLNLSQSAAISESMTAARIVLGSMRRSVPICKHHVQQAAFVVLKSPDIPSMLVETDYLSDPAEELRLHSSGYRRRIADAIFHGISAYFRDHPPAGTLFAEQRQERMDRLMAAGN